MRTKATITTARCLALATTLAITAVASAQEGRAPSPGELDAPSPLGAYAAGIILAGAALAICAMPSRRTHED